jgi:phage terminase small subunit
MAKLNDKQKRFCEEYIVDLNASAAARRAGYSEKTAYSIGQRLLKKDEAHAYIQELQQNRAKKVALDAEWVLNRLKEISDKCMQAEPVVEWDHGAREMIETGEYQFDSTGANRATELIGKHLGMFKDKLEIGGDLSVNIQVDYGDDDGDNS